MKFRLSDLVRAPLGKQITVEVQEGGQKLDQELEIDFLEGEIQFTRVDRGIYAEGHLQTRVPLNCVRCLDPISYPLEIEIAEQYFFSRQEGEEESSHLLSPEGTVDLTEPIRQQIWVNLPLQPLCQPDCRGLCAQCGANLNHEECSCEKEAVDPRLALLKELL